MPQEWYQQDKQKVIDQLHTHIENGLASKWIKRKQREVGENKLAEEKRASALTIFVNQFKDFMVMVLLATTVISGLLGEYVDSLAILAIVVLNAVLGFFQEYRAERSLEALKELTAPLCTVIREGRQQTIEAVQLVPGDLLLIQAGDRIPADCRLLSCSAFSVDESALTGESIPVEKDASWQGKSQVSLGDQANMVFMGTLATRGKGKAVVVATGMDTEIGKIANLIQDSLTMDTPLQARLAQLGKWLVAACLVIVALVFGLGVIQGFPVYKMFLTGVSLAVAAIPEGLPAVVTIALAVGVQRMIRRQAIVRQLPAVETLGCATVICSDKTGTLTQNKMKVQQYYYGEKWLKVGEEKIDSLLLKVGVVCNDAYLDQKGTIVGDPTEGALMAVANQQKLNLASIKRQYKRVAEIPFDSARKRMSVCVEKDNQYFSFVKGAPDIVLTRCTKVQMGSVVRRITAKDRLAIQNALSDMGEQALRVLALAIRELPGPSEKENVLEEGLTFLGLVGMIDPPRPEAKRAISQAKKAGIRTIMVTGDHKKTAAAIARDLGLLTHDSQVVTGSEWERLTSRAKQEKVKNTAVFARVAPEHKLTIVRALQANGEIVGMTGDGVNDAPAVKEADIGISMGLSGTDVTKEASAMILSDDNFQTIIAAIEEGRAIYDNIRKFIRYLLGCNVGEVLTMLFATMLGLPLPLVPIQILWMNLVTDGLPAIALGVDPGDQDIMERPPRPGKEGIFARRLHLKIGFTGIVISLCTIGIFIFALWYYGGDLPKARTLAFTTLVAAQLIYVFQCRSEHHSIFEIGVFGNLFLLIAVTISFGMHVTIIYHPWLQGIFRTVPLSLDEWLLVFTFSAWTLVIDTVARLVKRQINRYISWVKVGN